MTSDQIKNDNTLDSQYFWIWLKECAYQLAVMNEQNQSFDESLGSTVPPDSESALRGGIVACLRSCAQTVRENQMQGWEAANYIEAYALTVLHQKQPTSGLPTPDLAGSPNSNTNEQAEQADRKLVPIWVRDWVREYVQQEMCQCHSFMDALEIVNAMNAIERTMRPDPQSASIQAQEHPQL
jgi:hypothetical protein